jgi:hypothetical protein
MLTAESRAALKAVLSQRRVLSLAPEADNSLGDHRGTKPEGIADIVSY